MFIVLEGLDGAGKSTQIKLLREMFSKRGIESEYLHFPRFDAPLYGELIAQFLRGELGDLESVNPQLVALLYAGDRADAAPMINQWISQGRVVIIDRYIYSNVAYQCAKVQGDYSALREWILQMEYDHFKIPHPDISLFLDVPFTFTQSSLSQQREGDDRSYLNGAKDIHESSLDLQQRVRSVYIDSAERSDDFNVVDCSDEGGAMARPEIIFERIMEHVTPLINR